MRVLYVEDDDDNAYMMQRRLQRHGVEVIRAVDVDSGRRELAGELPDVVLLDLHLPDADGRVLLRHIRSTPALEVLPVIVVSAHVMSDERAATMAAGADAFLPKPLDFQRLLDTLHGLVSGGMAGED